MYVNLMFFWKKYLVEVNGTFWTKYYSLSSKHQPSTNDFFLILLIERDQKVPEKHILI